MERMIVAENNEAVWVAKCDPADWRNWSFTYHFKAGYYREFTPFYRWSNVAKGFIRDVEAD